MSHKPGTLVDVTSLLSPEHRAHLAALPGRYAMFSGWSMVEDGDDPDGDDPDGGGGDDLDPETVLKVDGREFRVKELQSIMAREKRQGRRAGQTALLRDLGFADADALRDFIDEHRQSGGGGDDDPQGGRTGGGGNDPASAEALRRAAERERRAEEREREANRRARRADLRGALREAGATGDDLDDAYALLDRAVDRSYEDDDLTDAVQELKGRRPALFGVTDDPDDQGGRERRSERRTSGGRGNLPPGRPGQRPAPRQTTFGAGGLERAKQKGWVS